MPINRYEIVQVSPATGSTWNATSSTIQSLDAGAGYTEITKYYQFFSAQSSTAIWIPASGKRWVITDLNISTSTNSDITLIDGTSTLITFYFETRGGAVSNYRTPIVSSAVNNILKITTTASSCSILLSGYER
jgi:hypothetical protein